jgi:IS5 family transposase
MLRIYCLQQWYALSDPGMEEALYDSQSMRAFAGISGGEDVIPDESTILGFRHLLERHRLTEAILAEVNAYLSEKGLLMSRGTIVDATIIQAPTSTKNAADSGLTHTLVCSAANVADNAVMGELIHGGEQALWGDAGYAGNELQQMAEQAGYQWNVQERGHRHQPLTERGQVSVGPCKGALSGVGQERRADARAVRLGQPVQSPSAADASIGTIASVVAGNGQTQQT